MLDKTTLVITAWRRPAYLKRALESWALTPELAELNYMMVALGWSPRFDDMHGVVQDAQRALGRHVHVMRDSPEAAGGPGMHRALGEAIDVAFRQPGTEWVLCSEEDVIVSPDALGLVSWAQHHAYGEHTLAICLHNRGGTGWDGVDRPREDGTADQEAVRELPYFNPWGWCIRRDKWEQVARPVWDWDCTSGGDRESGYDWQMQRLSSAGPWHNLVPDAARSQNIGELNGVYSTPGIFANQQSLSFRRQREMPVPYRLEAS